MANELTVKSALQFAKGNISVSRSRTHSVTISGSKWSGGTLTLSTNAQVIPIQLTTASYIWFCNTDTTHSLDIHHSAAAEDAYGFSDPLFTLDPGQTAQFPPGDGTVTWYAVAQTGTPILEYFAVSE